MNQLDRIKSLIDILNKIFPGRHAGISIDFCIHSHRPGELRTEYWLYVEGVVGIFFEDIEDLENTVYKLEDKWIKEYSWRESTIIKQAEDILKEKKNG